MKIFGAVTVVAALVQGQSDERKVPPRTPAQRLNTLKRFATEWVNAQIGVGINRPNRAANMVGKGIERLESKMTDAAAKECFFFDPTVPHGGPNPDTQGRKRRAAWVEKELNRIQREVDSNDDLDVFDQYFAALEVRGFDGQVRLSDDVDLAWKQIGTGFRKWILRYIADCNGQKTYQYHTNRLAKIHGNIQTAYETVGESQEMDYDEDDSDYSN